MPDLLEVSPNFQPAPGVEYEETPAGQPAKVEEPAKPAAEAPKAEEPKPEGEKPKVEEPKVETPTKVERQPKKATPFQTLLEKKHEAETQRDEALAQKAELETKLKELSQQTPGTATDDDIKTLAEETGIDETILSRIVAAARKGFQPTLPKEVQELIAKNQFQEQEKAEQEAFNADYSRLEATLSDELLKKPEVKEKLLALAYSDQKAPDGEPFYKKPLYELYAKFVKPEVEPGAPSAESSRGGSGAGSQVIDFQEILDRDDPKEIAAMDEPTFAKYNEWVNEKGGRTPIRRS